MSTRTRMCPSCYAIHPATTKVCGMQLPGGGTCDYTWPVLVECEPFESMTCAAQRDRTFCNLDSLMPLEGSGPAHVDHRKCRR